MALGSWFFAYGPKTWPLALDVVFGSGFLGLALGPWPIVLVLGPWPLALSHWLLDFGPSPLDPGPSLIRQMLALGHWLWPQGLALGTWPIVLALGPWPFAFGLWLLAPVSWILALGPWLLVLILCPWP